MRNSSAFYGLAVVYVSHRFLTAEARLQSQTTLCGIFGAQRGAGNRFFSEYFWFSLSAPFRGWFVLITSSILEDKKST